MRVLVCVCLACLAGGSQTHSYLFLCHGFTFLLCGWIKMSPPPLPAEGLSSSTIHVQRIWVWEAESDNYCNKGMTDRERSFNWVKIEFLNRLLWINIVLFYQGALQRRRETIRHLSPSPFQLPHISSGNVFILFLRLMADKAMIWASPQVQYKKLSWGKSAVQYFLHYTEKKHVLWL